MHWLCWLIGHKHWVRTSDRWQNMPFDNLKYEEQCVRCGKQEMTNWVRSHFTEEEVKEAKVLAGIKKNVQQ